MILWLIDWLLSLIIILVSFYFWSFESSFIEGSATGIYWLEFVNPVCWLFLVVINIVVHMYLLEFR